MKTEAVDSPALPTAAALQTRNRQARAVVASVIGNALEVYDFSVYALYAVIIGRQFFPVQSAFGQLMLAVSVFGIGFILRPLGALLLGGYADRAGRKAAMTLTILMMACGTGLLAITPTYASIGIAAPLLVLLARPAPRLFRWRRNRRRHDLPHRNCAAAQARPLYELAERKPGSCHPWRRPHRLSASYGAVAAGPGVMGLASAFSPRPPHRAGRHVHPPPSR